MRFEAHCKRCQEALGAPFPEVHRWLDAFASKQRKKRQDLSKGVDPCWAGPSNAEHRKQRHNKEGIEEVRKMWGDKAAEAAELHIIDDMFGSDRSKAWDIPADPQDYTRKGFM